jgi:hypothetical protein
VKHVGLVSNGFCGVFSYDITNSIVENNLKNSYGYFSHRRSIHEWVICIQLPLIRSENMGKITPLLKYARPYFLKQTTSVPNFIYDIKMI